MSARYAFTAAPGDAWTLHAAAMLRGAAPAADRIALDEIRARSVKVMRGGEFYAQMAASSLDYGPAFQNIVNVWQRDGEALAQIAPPPPRCPERFRVHPVLLDACVQAVSAALPAASVADGVLLPIGIRRLHFFGNPGAEAWSHGGSARRSSGRWRARSI